MIALPAREKRLLLFGGVALVDIDQRTDAVQRRPIRGCDAPPAHQMPAIRLLARAAQPQLDFGSLIAQRLHDCGHVGRMNQVLTLLQRRADAETRILVPRAIDEDQPVVSRRCHERERRQRIGERMKWIAAAFHFVDARAPADPIGDRTALIEYGHVAAANAPHFACNVCDA